VQEDCLKLTVSVRAKILHNIAHANVNDAEETLILLLELLLVENLNS
jgi:hypothetical protein